MCWCWIRINNNSQSFNSSIIHSINRLTNQPLNQSISLCVSGFRYILCLGLHHVKDDLVPLPHALSMGRTDVVLNYQLPLPTAQPATHKALHLYRETDTHSLEYFFGGGKILSNVSNNINVYRQKMVLNHININEAHKHQ